MVHDELVFVGVGGEITCAGQVLGVVVGDSQALAQKGAAAVRVEYEELEAVLSIEEARARL